MTREDVILLANQCGIGYRDISEEFYTGYCDGVVLEQMYAFALRAIEKEREACALRAEDFLTEPEPDWDGDFWNQAIERVAMAIRARGEA